MSVKRRRKAKNEKDDTQYIEESEEVYINGCYIKRKDWVEVNKEK